MRSKVLKPLDFSAFINGTDAMKTEQTTAERMCYIVNDKDLSQQAKEYFAQIRKTDRLIHRLDSTIATLRSSLTSTGSQLKQDKVQTSGPKNTLEETITKIIDLEAKINARIDELVSMNYSMQWVFELHGKGLLAFAKANSDFLNNRENQSATGSKQSKESVE